MVPNGAPKIAFWGGIGAETSGALEGPKIGDMWGVLEESPNLLTALGAVCCREGHTPVPKTAQRGTLCPIFQKL